VVSCPLGTLPILRQLLRNARGSDRSNALGPVALRAARWRQWKTPRRRRAALLELGVRERLANNTAGSGRGPWYLAKAKALAVGLSNAYFKSLGLPSLFEDC
jgi:hypothetical protein